MLILFKQYETFSQVFIAYSLTIYITNLSLAESLYNSQVYTFSQSLLFQIHTRLQQAFL